MHIFRGLVTFVACLVLTAATPLPTEEEEAGEHEHGLFPSNNDSEASTDLAMAGRNATIELTNETMSNGSAPTNATAVAEGVERAENGSAVLRPSKENGTMEGTMEGTVEGNGKEAVEEAEEGVKDLPDGEPMPKLFNATKDEAEEALEDEDKVLAEPKTTTGGSGEKMTTTEKAVAGLKGDDDGAAVPLTTPGAPMSLSAHPLEKDPGFDESTVEPSVLQMHPVLRKNRTIQFRAGEPDEWRPYVDNMAAFLEPYAKEAQERNTHCDFEKSLQEDQACRFDLVYLGPSCTKENNFGYGIGKPCVLITPGKFADWVPSPYDNDTTDVPDEVQRLMRIFNANFLFVTCEGESEADRANIGPMAYLPPYQGFPSYFFPNKKDTVPSYVAPLMAIEFLNPTNGTLINVACKAWAKNVPELPHPATLRFSLQVN